MGPLLVIEVSLFQSVHNSQFDCITLCALIVHVYDKNPLNM